MVVIIRISLPTALENSVLHSEKSLLYNYHGVFVDALPAYVPRSVVTFTPANLLLPTTGVKWSRRQREIQISTTSNIHQPVPLAPHIFFIPFRTQRNARSASLCIASHVSPFNTALQSLCSAFPCLSSMPQNCLLILLGLVVIILFAHENSSQILVNACSSATPSFLCIYLQQYPIFFQLIRSRRYFINSPFRKSYINKQMECTENSK